MRIYGTDVPSDEYTPTKIKKNLGSITLNTSKIKTKKFSDVALSFYSIHDLLYAEDGNEGYFKGYDDIDFLAYKFQKINGFFPNVFKFEDFDVHTFIKKLFDNYSIPDNAYMKIISQSERGSCISTFGIRFAKDLFLYVTDSNYGIFYYNPVYEIKHTSLLYDILGLIKNFKNPKVVKNKIYIVYKSVHGFEKMGFDVNKINVDLNENYNDDFSEVSKKIIEGLNSKDKTNLVILSGIPGTGKSSYIRYLTTKLKKNIIFISPDMVDSITDPAFIPFLMKNNDSVLIIEDAEPALEKRNHGGRSSAVSNVLNLTDGLLSDCLKISIVATFNTGLKNLDDALLRKGRLLMNYSFNKLNIEKSANLLKKLGHTNVIVNEPMTLADIYFYDSNNNSLDYSLTKVGFKK